MEVLWIDHIQFTKVYYYYNNIIIIDNNNWFLYSIFSKKKTCSKRFTHYYPQQACVVLHNYILFLVSPLTVYSPKSCGIYALRVLSCTIKAHLMPGYLFITCLGLNAWLEEQTSYNSVLRKFDQLPTFPHQLDSSQQPQDYQTDALDNCAT